MIHIWSEGKSYGLDTYKFLPLYGSVNVTNFAEYVIHISLMRYRRSNI